MYAEDSFFTLGMGGQLGLLFLSGTLAAFCIACVRLLRRRKAVIRLLAAFLLFWGFVWLSPQVYYLYYLTIFDDLPWQIVVGAPPGPMFIGRLLVFADRANLSFHGQGVLGWCLILCALLPGRRILR